MKEIAIEFLKEIEKHGFVSYIIGGFVRDDLIGIKSNDIDVTTNAKPKDLKKIFSDVRFPKVMNDEQSYGSVTINYKNIVFEVTTFRKELEYFDNRHPSEIVYVNDLKTDLLRRDFTINTICLNSKGEIIDLLDGVTDLNNKLIKSVINPKKSFKDDALRILRAIRFATTLNLKLDDELINGIKENKKYLKNISYDRKKIELDRIFASRNVRNGISLLKDLDLLEILEISNIDKVKDYSDLIGIWAMINPINYRFTRNEKQLIDKVNIAYNLDNLNPHVLYKYGLYINTIAGINKGISKKDITQAYNNIIIKSRKDINISANDISKILDKEPGAYINQIYTKLEIEILNGNLINNYDFIKEYILNLKKV